MPESTIIRLTEPEIKRLLALLDRAVALQDGDPLDLPLEGKLEGALMECGSSP